MTAYDRARQASFALADTTGVARHDVLVMLGSGWRPAAARLGDPSSVFAADSLPYGVAPRVEGHAAEIQSIDVGGRRVLVSLGRVHGYEGHTPDEVVHLVRTAVFAGCSTVVLTNAAGGIAPGLAIGQPVLIADHVNLTGASPLTGPCPHDLPRFPDLSDAWTGRLRDLARSVDPSLAEHVYAGVAGPQYETPAEIRMLQGMGAGLVGMSTVHEAIAAAHLGAEVLGISLVTNLAAGLGAALDHADVLAVAERSAEAMGELLATILPRL